MRLDMKNGIILTLFAIGLAAADMRNADSDSRCLVCEIDAAMKASRTASSGDRRQYETIEAAGLAPSAVSPDEKVAADFRSKSPDDRAGLR